MLFAIMGNTGLVFGMCFIVSDTDKVGIHFLLSTGRFGDERKGGGGGGCGSSGGRGGGGWMWLGMTCFLLLTWLAECNRWRILPLCSIHCVKVMKGFSSTSNWRWF